MTMPMSAEFWIIAGCVCWVAVCALVCLVGCLHQRIAALVMDLYIERKVSQDLCMQAMTWEDRYQETYEQAQELRIANKKRRDDISELRASIRDCLGLLSGYGYKNKGGPLERSKVFGQLKEMVEG